MPKKKRRSVALQTAIAPDVIERHIYLVRGHKVMLDVDLAKLYRVPTKRLNEQVSRNLARFPEDHVSANHRGIRIYAVANCDRIEAQHTVPSPRLH